MGINYKQIVCPWPVDDNSQFDHLWNNPSAQHFGYPKENLSKQLLEWIDLHGMLVGFAEIFYLPPNCNVRRIHTDLDVVTEFCTKINFILKGEDAIMQWFSPKDNTQGLSDINLAPTVLKKDQVSPYLSWKREDVTVIDEVTLKGANLIHAGIPHVVFTNAEPRIAISVVLYCKKEKRRLTVEEVLLRI
jgi:hypothetical protein